MTSSPPLSGIEMPPSFILERLTPDGSWMDCGLFEAGSWKREADGAYF